MKSPPTFRRFVSLGFVAYLFAVPWNARAATYAKRVLIIHSFGNAAPPFTTHSTAFETTLASEMGSPVELDEVSLDLARYERPEMETAFVQYLRVRLSLWQPDLVVPVGSPACRFAAKYRSSLFRNLNILYMGSDRRRIPPDALLQNAAFVGETYNLPGLVDDILQLKPDTERVAVVFGASPLERFWADVCRREFSRFSPRVQFTWLNDLTFEQMLEKLSTLPPHSYILWGLFLRDAAGVTQDGDNALRRIHAVANAPMNGLFRHEMGLGIVGGHLYRADAVGVEAARVAIRILRGTPISTIPPIILQPTTPQYDWRELRRWQIPEARLSPDAVIQFREKSLWERDRIWILGGMSVAAVEAGLLVLLIFNLLRRRRTERLLRESESRFRTVADSAPVLIWMSGTDQRCNFFNKPWLDFTGRTSEQEIGDGWLDGLHPDDRALCLETYRSAFNARRPFRMHYRLRRYDGQYRWVLDTGIPRSDAQDSFAGYIGSCIDFTDQRRAEFEREQLHQELSHVSRVATMGELTASIAHELNQPLAAILANAQAGIRFMASREPATEDIRAILSDIISDDKRAADVIRNLRSLLMKGELDRRPLEINSLIQEALTLVHSEAILHNVEIVTDFATMLPVILGNRVQLQQVIINLAANAFDAMSKVSVGLRQLTIRTEKCIDERIQIDVQDTGIGIPSEKLLSIFDPFVSTKSGGMGMGLSICRSILTRHGATIAAMNNPSGGATFTIFLPLAKLEPTAQRPQEEKVTATS